MARKASAWKLRAAYIGRFCKSSGAGKHCHDTLASGNCLRTGARLSAICCRSSLKLSLLSACWHSSLVWNRGARPDVEPRMQDFCGRSTIVKCDRNHVRGLPREGDIGLRTVHYRRGNKDEGRGCDKDDHGAGHSRCFPFQKCGQPLQLALSTLFTLAWSFLEIKSEILGRMIRQPPGPHFEHP